MSAGTEKQGEFMIAVEVGDAGLIEQAFSVLDNEDGHYECYGDTVGGAAGCYLARMGTDDDRAKLLKFLAGNEVALELCRLGLWDEPKFADSLIIEIFKMSNRDQRSDTLDILEITLSENEPVGSILDAFKNIELNGTERRVLRKLFKKATHPL